MYSRYGNDPKRPIRLPEHYGGSVFSQSQLPTEPVAVPKRESTKPFVRESVEEKVSPVADRLLRAEANEENAFGIPDPRAVVALPDEKVEEKEKIKEKAPAVPPEKKPSPLPIHFDGLRRLFGGKDGEGGEDQDRLLLLGLILLLSRTEGDSDILLWLSLLLLCG